MANERIRKQFTGGAVQTTLAAALTSSGTSVVLASGATYPATGAPFVIVIGRGTATEEKLLISARSVNTLTVLERGYDGSVAVAHEVGESVLHTVDSYVIDQANQLANVAVSGGIAYHNGTNWSARAIGAEGYPLLSKAGVPQYAKMGVGAIDQTGFLTYTPALVQGAALTSAASRNHYQRVGRHITGDVVAQASSAGTSGAQLTCTLPVAGASAVLDTIIGVAFFRRAADSAINYAMIVPVTTTVVRFHRITEGVVAQILGVSPVIAVASGDILSMQFSYEAAA